MALGVAFCLLVTGAGAADTVACSSDYRPITAALARMRRAIDPCGESVELTDVLSQLDRCAAQGYQICATTTSERNLFDRPNAAGQPSLGLVTWNPELRGALEEAQSGDASTAVWRDPTASLLHELVHVTQQCAGLNPGEHELEAVRIENIYRRAAGLSQRRGYGDLPLPPEQVRICTAASCPCSAPHEVPALAGEPKGFDSNRTGDRPD